MLYIDVNGDTVDVSRKDQADYKKAKEYASKDKKAKEVFDKAEKAPEHVKLVTNNKDNDSYKNKVIQWDPRSGLKVEGGTQSAALGLLHEVDHFVIDIEGRSDDTPDTQYDIKEEREVIEQAETPAAKTLGEPTRQTHRAFDQKHPFEKMKSVTEHTRTVSKKP